MKIYRICAILIVVVLLLAPSSVFAQTYLFSLDELIVHVYWNEDGTTSIDYLFTFTNNPGASPIDYVDVGLPNSDFDSSSITASADGQSLSDLSRGGFQGYGTGVAVGLGGLAILPGQTGRVHVWVPTVRDVIYQDDDDNDYVSGVFSPTWFGSQYVTGSTNMTVTFHFPPGVQPEEPRWHAAPAGWPSEPETGHDEQGRITYTWHNPEANGHTQYKFGASFPKVYVPETAIVTPTIWQTLGISPDDLTGFLCCGGFGSIILLIIWYSVRSTKRRKLKYLPPKIAIEGHGIKRGLTAVEASILLEQPMDKIMTMVLFAILKKDAAMVIKSDPLEIEVTDPRPDGLRPYETHFLNAFEKKDKRAKRKALQSMMVKLVKSVANKMKGFSRRETVAYYKDIVKRAWLMVESAETPEVKSEKFDEVMEWTMMDKDYDDRTRDVFRTGPVFVPIWWHRYDPVYRGSVASRPSTPSIPMTTTTGGRPSLSLPNLPGGAFAASVVGGVQNFSSGVVGNITDFTSGVTNKTNPVPVVKSSGGSFRGGGGSSCACACAGCACACAGGGR